jgi:hypothetical protein
MAVTSVATLTAARERIFSNGRKVQKQDFLFSLLRSTEEPFPEPFLDTAKCTSKGLKLSLLKT